jgi:hypothetical protein
VQAGRCRRAGAGGPVQLGRRRRAGTGGPVQAGRCSWGTRPDQQASSDSFIRAGSSDSFLVRQWRLLFWAQLGLGPLSDLLIGARLGLGPLLVFDSFDSGFELCLFMRQPGHAGPWIQAGPTSRRASILVKPAQALISEPRHGGAPRGWQRSGVCGEERSGVRR